MIDPPEPAHCNDIDFDGCAYRIEWFEPEWVPPLEGCTQAYGICFTSDGTILLVKDPSGWNLPGGGIDPGETLTQTLAREVMEEGCARVIDAEYIGCQRVTPNNDAARAEFDTRRPDLPFFYQTRFWARIELDEWNPMHETTERWLVTPERFRASLWWGAAPTAGFVLQNGVHVERARVISPG